MEKYMDRNKNIHEEKQLVYLFNLSSSLPYIYVKNKKNIHEEKQLVYLLK